MSMSDVNWRDFALLRSFFQKPNSIELKLVIHTSTAKRCQGSPAGVAADGLRPGAGAGVAFSSSALSRTSAFASRAASAAAASAAAMLAGLPLPSAMVPLLSLDAVRWGPGRETSQGQNQREFITARDARAPHRPIRFG